jgi:hypothetical protein
VAAAVALPRATVVPVTAAAAPARLSDSTADP